MHTFQTFLLVVPILLFSVIAHEIAHGYAALKQGDRTALEAGRLSWNPIRHIDPFFTILLPLLMFSGSSAFGRSVIFGGAKPVPVDPRNYRNIRRGDIIVSLAGVFVNLIIALLCTAIIPVIGIITRSVPAITSSMVILQAMLVYGILMNLGLIAFNLLPIPPLDGSHVMKYLLPRPLAIKYVQFGKYGILVLFALLFMRSPVLDYWFRPATFVSEKLLDIVTPYVLVGVEAWFK
ncbi:MAG: site-2 protease family protein [Gemmatimonadota bacterium]